MNETLLGEVIFGKENVSNCIGGISEKKEFASSRSKFFLVRVAPIEGKGSFTRGANSMVKVVSLVKRVVRPRWYGSTALENSSDCLLSYITNYIKYCEFTSQHCQIQKIMPILQHEAFIMVTGLFQPCSSNTSQTAC